MKVKKIGLMKYEITMGLYDASLFLVLRKMMKNPKVRNNEDMLAELLRQQFEMIIDTFLSSGDPALEAVAARAVVESEQE